jgi:hypothetical protein
MRFRIHVECRAEKFLSKYIKCTFQTLLSFHIHMEYEESIGLMSRKMKKKIIAYSHVLELFLAKKHDLSEKIPSATRRCRFH